MRRICDECIPAGEEWRERFTREPVLFERRPKIRRKVTEPAQSFRKLPPVRIRRQQQSHARQRNIGRSRALMAEKLLQMLPCFGERFAVREINGSIRGLTEQRAQCGFIRVQFGRREIEFANIITPAQAKRTDQRYRRSS